MKVLSVTYVISPVVSIHATRPKGFFAMFVENFPACHVDDLVMMLLVMPIDQITHCPWSKRTYTMG